MSNSPLVVHTNLSPNKTSPRRSAIDTITIHCMAVDISIERCGEGFVKPSRRASSNYGIGSDGRIALYVDEADRSWCSSNSANDHRAVTIEVACENVHPYKVTDEALGSLVTLCADICQRNGIAKLVWSTDRNQRVNHRNGCNMTVHRDFAAKACPGDYLYNAHGEIAEAVNIILEDNNMSEMDMELFKKLWFEMRRELQDNDSSEYSEAAREWAVSNGLMIGNENGELMWEDLLTREQFITVLYRYHMMCGGA